MSSVLTYLIIKEVQLIMLVEAQGEDCYQVNPICHSEAGVYCHSVRCAHMSGNDLSARPRPVSFPFLVYLRVGMCVMDMSV